MLVFVFRKFKQLKLKKNYRTWAVLKLHKTQISLLRLLRIILTSVPVLLTEFNESLKLSRFPHSMKSANITPVFKKNGQTDKTNYKLVSYFRIYQKSLKDAFINNYQHILIGYFLSNNVDLERVSMHNKVY